MLSPGVVFILWGVCYLMAPASTSIYVHNLHPYMGHVSYVAILLYASDGGGESSSTFFRA